MKTMTCQEAEILIEQYYEGRTTREEEQQLRIFLQQENLPEQFSAEAAMFGYFGAERTKIAAPSVENSDVNSPRLSDPEDVRIKTPPKGRRFLFRPMVTWSVAAAAVVCGVLILNNLNRNPQSAVAYVNGVECTNADKIKDLALASIQDVGLETDDVAGSVDNLNDQNIVESQLNLLAN